MVTLDRGASNGGHNACTSEPLAKREEVAVWMRHLEVKLDRLQQDTLVRKQLLLTEEERSCGEVALTSLLHEMA